MYRIMLIERYPTEGGIMEEMDVEADGERYRTRHEAEMAKIELQDDPMFAGEIFYIEEV